MAIDPLEVENWERMCPECRAVTKRHSIDGGLTSQYHGECGHHWDVTPMGKTPWTAEHVETWEAHRKPRKRKA